MKVKPPSKSVHAQYCREDRKRAATIKAASWCVVLNIYPTFYSAIKLVFGVLTYLIMVNFHGGVGQGAKYGDNGDFPYGHLTD